MKTFYILGLDQHKLYTEHKTKQMTFTKQVHITNSNRSYKKLSFIKTRYTHRRRNSK